MEQEVTLLRGTFFVPKSSGRQNFSFTCPLSLRAEAVVICAAGISAVFCKYPKNRI